MRRRIGLPAVVCALALGSALWACDAGAPPAAEAPADTAAEGAGIPIRFVGPNEAALVVAVHLNGRGPYDFVLDTGATFTCVDDALSSELDLPERPGAGGFGAGVTGSGRVRVVELDSIRIGDATAYDLMACALDLSSLRSLGTDVQGLVGLNVLRSFRMTLDFEEERLYLTKP